MSLAPIARVRVLQSRVSTPTFEATLGGQRSVGKLTRIVGLTM